MRTFIVIVASFAVLAIPAAAYGRAPAHFTSCPRHLDGIPRDRYVVVSGIAVKNISCGTAYTDIEKFVPLRPGALNGGYSCTFKPVPPDSDKGLCTQGSRAFRFTDGGA